MSGFRSFLPGLPGGHLGSSVSALLDGQLDPETAERAWQHAVHCAPCRRLVEREGWVKRQLAQMAGSEPSAPAHLVGSLSALDPRAVHDPRPEGHALHDEETHAAWHAVGELEHRGRGRRRAGIAAIGVGSVSAAVLGLTTLSGAQLGIGGAPSGPPPASLTRPSTTPQPVMNPSGTPSWWFRPPGGSAERSTPVSVRSPR